jgi:hypothetical protein
METRSNEQQSDCQHRNDQRSETECETSPNAPYNRTYQQPGSTAPEGDEKVEERNERAKEPYHGSKNP